MVMKIAGRIGREQNKTVRVIAMRSKEIRSAQSVPVYLTTLDRHIVTRSFVHCGKQRAATLGMTPCNSTAETRNPNVIMTVM